MWDHTALPASTPARRRALDLLPRRDGRLSWPRWLITYRDGVPVHRQSPIRARSRVTSWCFKEGRHNTRTRWVDMASSHMGSDSKMHVYCVILAENYYTLNKTNTANVHSSCGPRISFLFARCRYLSIFGILLVNNWPRHNLKNPTQCKNREYLRQSVAEV